MSLFEVSDRDDEILPTVHLETADDPSNSLAGVGAFSLTVRRVPAPRTEVLAAAAQAAAVAEVAVVVVGLTEEQETEAVDKSTIALPGDQDALVAAVAAAAKKTVVVVNSATPVLMPWAGDVDAILWAGLPGQEGGHAVAAALLGEIEPAGRLVTTFPAADGAAPAWEVVPTDGALHYSEGTAIGYRGHFAGNAPEPAFWLGHGLGYSTWSYDAAALVSGADADSPTVQVTITNTGSRDRRELVQVYLHPSDTDQPVRLMGWATVDVAAGDHAEVQVGTDSKLWRRWDITANTWGTPRTGANSSSPVVSAASEHASPSDQPGSLFPSRGKPHCGQEPPRWPQCGSQRRCSAPNTPVGGDMPSRTQAAGRPADKPGSAGPQEWNYEGECSRVRRRTSLWGSVAPGSRAPRWT